MKHLDGLITAQRNRGKQVRLGWSTLSLGLLLLLVQAGREAVAQVAESANISGLKLSVGTTASAYFLQYGSVKNLGLTAYVDADSLRRLGMEGEGRWLLFHQTNDIHAETYLVGPRYHFNLGRYQPYVKALSGLGLFNFTYNYAHGSYYVIAPGAGLDYALNHRWSVRVDGEYQYWPQFTFGPMSSAGVSVGIRCFILR